jgi:hypothetical protein
MHFPGFQESGQGSGIIALHQKRFSLNFDGVCQFGILFAGHTGGAGAQCEPKQKNAQRGQLHDITFVNTGVRVEQAHM